MNPRLRRWMVLTLAWLPLAAAAQSSVGDSSVEAQPEIKAGNLAFMAGFNALYRLDLSSGAATVVGSGFGNVGGVAVADVDSLAFAPDGTLYAVADSPQALFRVSTSTGRATLVGQFREGGQTLDPSTNLNGALGFTCSGKLLMSSRTQRRLYEVDAATASVRAVGSLAAALGGLAAIEDSLFGLGVEGSEGLYRIAESDAAANRLPSALGGRVYRGGAIAFGADGRLFAAFDNYPQSGPTLAELARDTGAVLREVAITRPQLDNRADDRPVRALAIAPPVCGPFVGNGPGAVSIPALDARTLALLALLLGAIAFVALRRTAP
jgi:hypothetical protein